MIKRIVATAILTGIYKIFRDGFKAHPYYKAGIIDLSGTKIDKSDMTQEQRKVVGQFNEFTFSLLKIITSYPVIKYAFMSSLLKTIFLKESAETSVSLGKVVDHHYLETGTIVIVNEALSEDPFYRDSNTIVVFCNEGEFVIDKSAIIQVYLDEEGEITNTTDGVDLTPHKKKSLMRKALMRRQEEVCKDE